MCKLESAQENKMWKILWIFKIQSDPQIPARRPELVLQRKIKDK